MPITLTHTHTHTPAPQIAPLCSVRVSGVSEGRPGNVLSSEPDAYFETDESSDPLPWIEVTLPANVRVVSFNKCVASSCRGWLAGWLPKTERSPSSLCWIVVHCCRLAQHAACCALLAARCAKGCCSAVCAGATPAWRRRDACVRACVPPACPRPAGLSSATGTGAPATTAFGRSPR